MTNKKLCPLKKLPNGMFGYCNKTKCAWYDPYECECAIWTIMLRLTNIYDILKIIKETIKELKKEE